MKANRILLGKFKKRSGWTTLHTRHGDIHRLSAYTITDNGHIWSMIMDRVRKWRHFSFTLLVKHYNLPTKTKNKNKNKRKKHLPKKNNNQTKKNTYTIFNGVCRIY